MPRPPRNKTGPRPGAKAGPRPPQGLPDRDALARFITEAGESDITDIARHFGLKGADRRALREMVRSLEGDGTLARRGRKGFAKPGEMPPVGVADVVERDVDGDLFVRLTKGAEDAPLVRLAPGRAEKAGGAPGLGDRLLVHFDRIESGEYEARLIKRLGQSAHKVLGVIRKSHREVRVEPVDRKSKQTLVLTDPSAQDLSLIHI